MAATQGEARQRALKAALAAAKDANNADVGRIREEIRKAVLKANIADRKAEAEAWALMASMGSASSRAAQEGARKEFDHAAAGIQPKGYDTFISALLDIAMLALALSKVMNTEFTNPAMQALARIIGFHFQTGILCKPVFNKPKDFGIVISASVNNGILQLQFRPKHKENVSLEEHAGALTNMVHEYLKACGYRENSGVWEKNGQPLTQQHFDEFNQGLQRVDEWVQELLAAGNDQKAKFNIAVKMSKMLGADSHATAEHNNRPGP